MKYDGIGMKIIELPDEHATKLTAKAAARGLSLEGWLKQLAEDGEEVSVAAGEGGPRRHIADVIRESMQDIPREVMASMPADGASQHDHYIYGWPKREA